MKTFNLKTILVFALSALLFTSLASCSNSDNKVVSNMMDDNVLASNTDSSMMDDTTSSWWTDEQKKSMEEETMMWEENQTMNNEETESSKLWVYTDYSPEALKNASWNIVLFFHADWCPTCQAIEKDILSKEVPSGLTILKVDYDTATDLKKKYNVLTQSSFVQVDNEWNMIKRWISWRWLDDIVKKVQ